MAWKLCNRCGISKNADDFYSHDNSCKECRRAAVRSYRAKNITIVQEYDRKRGLLSHRKAKVKANAWKYPRDIKAMRSKYPERYAARTALGNALRDGLLAKPEKCQHCRQESALHGHHEDYDRPLEVIWLCKDCHGVRHRDLNEWRRNSNAVHL